MAEIEIDIDRLLERLEEYEEFARPTNPVCADIMADAKAVIEEQREGIRRNEDMIEMQECEIEELQG